MYNTILCFLCVCKTCKNIWCDYIIDCSCYSEENKNRRNFLCATAWITIAAKSNVWIAITFSLLMQMPRFTYHFNSFNLLFKAVPNLVQSIAFEKIYTRTYSDPSIWVRSSCEVRSLLLIHRYKSAAWVRQNCCEQLNFRRRMGGTNKLLLIGRMERGLHTIVALIELESHREKNGSNQSFDFIKDFKSSVKSLCD